MTREYHLCATSLYVRLGRHWHFVELLPSFELSDTKRDLLYHTNQKHLEREGYWRSGEQLMDVLAVWPYSPAGFANVVSYKLETLSLQDEVFTTFMPSEDVVRCLRLCHDDGLRAESGCSGSDTRPDVNESGRVALLARVQNRWYHVDIFDDVQSAYHRAIDLWNHSRVLTEGNFHDDLIFEVLGFSHLRDVPVAHDPELVKALVAECP